MRPTVRCLVLFILGIPGSLVGVSIDARLWTVWITYLGAAVLLWVAGFDVIYACQDAEVDRREGLRSIPARLGVPGALRIAAVLHGLCVAAFVMVAPLAGLRWPYLAAVGVAAALLAYEHTIVSPTDLSRVNVAFFNVNGIVALLVGAAGIVDRLT